MPLGDSCIDSSRDRSDSKLCDLMLGYPVLAGNDREDFEGAFGPFWGLPTSFVIDRQVRLQKKHQGLLTLQQLEREIRPLIST
jgi:hypothetical protein